MHARVHAHLLYESSVMYEGTHRGQKRPSYPLDPGSQVWVLGTELGSSARATSTLNC